MLKWLVCHGVIFTNQFGALVFVWTMRSTMMRGMALVEIHPISAIPRIMF